MVCGDRRLGQLDRRLNHAFYLALLAGVPRDRLRAEQDRWEDLSERAARHGKGAVARLYERRIARLRALAG